MLNRLATGHVLFMDTATRTPITAIDVGVQSHAAYAAPDDSYVVVANQNGKLLHRIDTDADGDGIPYENAGDIALDPTPLNLAIGTTPSGAPREFDDPTLGDRRCGGIETKGKIYINAGGPGHADL